VFGPNDGDTKSQSVPWSSQIVSILLRCRFVFFVALPWNLLYRQGSGTRKNTSVIFYVLCWTSARIDFVIIVVVLISQGSCTSCLGVWTTRYLWSQRNYGCQSNCQLNWIVIVTNHGCSTCYRCHNGRWQMDDLSNNVADNWITSFIVPISL
jgi:hypothetical protein